METLKSRSESPFSRSKTKSQSLEPPENGDSTTEQEKRKKKTLRNKCKSQTNGKETKDFSNDEKDYIEEDKAVLNEVDNNVDSNNTEHENGINNGDSVENRENGQKKGACEINENRENDALISACDSLEEKIDDEPNGKETMIIITKECKSTEITNVSIKDDTTEQCSSSETERGAKNESIVPCDSLAESEVVYGIFEETCNGKTDEIINGENNVTLEPEATVESSEIKEISLNESDVSSHYEEANANNEDHIQASPDTATKDDNFFSNKIASFLGKWSCSQEQKQDSEISSFKKIDEATLNHPYLSKVSGRRGIKDRLNSSATVFSSKEPEVKTPENSGKALLDDSFRVRTNPPRLGALDLKENSTLRKFKGKRCLNTGDDPEEEVDMYINTIKRRKLETEKAQESGLLGSILWSPFKKKSLDYDNQIELRTESKLSRLLSPFWFWKKAAAAVGQKGK